MTVQLGEDLEITICGRTYRFVRSLETLMRAEAVVGAVARWAERLEHHQCKLEEIAAIYAALIERTGEGPALPTKHELDEWIFKRGLQNHDDLAVFLYSLTMGREEIERVLRWKALRMAANRTAAGGQNA